VRENKPGLIQIVVVSPISSLRVGLKTILGEISEIEVIGEAASLEDFSMLPPSDLVLLATLENPSSAWINALIEQYPDRRFLFLINPSDGAPSHRFLSPHPIGFISLNATSEEISGAVCALLAGLWVIDPEFIGQIMQDSGSTKNPKFSRSKSFERDPDDSQFSIFDSLTPRETDVLQCLARGMPNKESASNLSISEHTVKYHITSIYSKLGVNNRTEAVRQGIIRGIILI
jgi:NarL family two-component system response regulator YdfI